MRSLECRSFCQVSPAAGPEISAERVETGKTGLQTPNGGRHLPDRWEMDILWRIGHTSHSEGLQKHLWLDDQNGEILGGDTWSLEISLHLTPRSGSIYQPVCFPHLECGQLVGQCLRADTNPIE